MKFLQLFLFSDRSVLYLVLIFKHFSLFPCLQFLPYENYCSCNSNYIFMVNCTLSFISLAFFFFAIFNVEFGVLNFILWIARLWVLTSVHRILQVSILEWVAMPSSRGSFWPKDHRIELCFVSLWEILLFLLVGVLCQVMYIWMISIYSYTHLYVYVCVCILWKSLSRVWLFMTLWTIQPMEFSRQNAWVGSCSLFQGSFPIQGSNPGLLHCR